ncbi:unnamed protein product [Lasius platythorax]|uniref:Uncharacterized protein n=1 Tax=Lasius platythorax TaxID=488582 RepID=A0AAV2P939_9HYME
MDDKDKTLTEAVTASIALRESSSNFTSNLLFGESRENRLILMLRALNVRRINGEAYVIRPKFIMLITIARSEDGISRIE